MYIRIWSTVDDRGTSALETLASYSSKDDKRYECGTNTLNCDHSASCHEPTEKDAYCR